MYLCTCELKLPRQEDRTHHPLYSALERGEPIKNPSCWPANNEITSLNLKILKQPLGMTSILVYFRTEVVYPTDHVFIFFGIFTFLQIFLINISMKPEETQTNYLYTWRTIECFHSIGPHADVICPALGRQSVLQVCPLVSWLWDTNYPPIRGDCSDLTVWYVGICDGKCLILLTCFVYMAIYNLEIQLFCSFSEFKIVFWLFRIFS